MTKTLDKPATAPTFDWRFYKDWFFRVWSAVRNIDITATNNGNTQIDGNLTVTGNLSGMPLSLLSAAAGEQDGAGGQFLSSAGIGLQTYTPTTGALSGTFTVSSASGQYYQVNKLVFFDVIITIGTVTTAGYVTFTLPPGLPIGSANTIFAGRENAVIGYMLQATVSLGSVVTMLAYDNNPSVKQAGDQLLMSGCYYTP